MPARLFVLVGHPRESSLSHGLADAYIRGAQAEGAEVRRMNLHDMAFDPDLTDGYLKRKDHEPAITEFLEHTMWADHLAWFHPLWWGGMPGKMQGLIDRAFLPGIAFAYHKDDPWWDRLLAGRTADVFVTADTPGFFIKWIYRNPHKNRITKQILEFTGVKVTGYSYFSAAKTAKEAKIQAWMRKAYNRGADAGRR
ncbi:MAG: NAD(P)H-dependent oxidoreductase [Pseudomonadota bacterium]